MMAVMLESNRPSYFFYVVDGGSGETGKNQ